MVERANTNLAANDELALVLAARGGDESAFKTLYLANVNAIFGFVAARTDRHTAEDLTADTFAKAYAAIGRFEPREVPFRAWLFRIAHNLVIGRARRRSSSEVGLQPEHAHALVDPAPDVERQVSGALDAERLRECLALLPESQATVLDLRYLRELSVAETAAALELSEEAVRALSYRSLKALRALFVPAGGADNER